MKQVKGCVCSRQGRGRRAASPHNNRDGGTQGGMKAPLLRCCGADFDSMRNGGDAHAASNSAERGAMQCRRGLAHAGPSMHRRQQQQFTERGCLPVASSGRHSIMVRSMDADSRQGGWVAPPPPSGTGGCQATECTQSSCPIRTASRVAAYVCCAARMSGRGA